MSVNIRDYVSKDQIESISEIATGQASIIQALSLDNSQKDKEIERLNKTIELINANAMIVFDKAMQYENIITELEKWLELQLENYNDIFDVKNDIERTLDKLKELKEVLKREIH